MPNKEGEVGGGHQNTYEPMGTVYQKFPAPGKLEPQPIIFKKADRKAATWKTSPSWTAGTPITWKDKISEAVPVTDEVGDVEMLVSRDQTGAIQEFHPLITFYNKVLAEIHRNPDTRGLLDTLSVVNGREAAARASAKKLWAYLVDRYDADRFSTSTLASKVAKVVKPKKKK